MSRIKKTDEKTPWARKQLGRDDSIKRQVQNTFLIYCEGENTEPEYFRSFPVNTETIVKAVGLGMSRTALIEAIIERVRDQRFLPGQPEFDPDRHIWCVFDMDTKGEDGEEEDFDEAVRLAIAHGFRVGYSNDSFELWLCLHDHCIESRLVRKQYFERLSTRLGFNYEKHGKTKEVAKSLYGIFHSGQSNAIRHAHRLNQLHQEEPRHSQRNPCTTIHELVLELNACLKR